MIKAIAQCPNGRTENDFDFFVVTERIEECVVDFLGVKENGAICPVKDCGQLVKKWKVSSREPVKGNYVVLVEIQH